MVSEWVLDITTEHGGRRPLIFSGVAQRIGGAANGAVAVPIWVSGSVSERRR